MNNPKELYDESKNKKGYKSFYQLGVKRAIDIITCLIVLPIVLIVLILVAIAIKIEDHGPIFIVPVDWALDSRSMEC